MPKNKGFTLIEVIIVLTMVGIIATAAGIGIVSIVQGFVFAKGNVALVQKGQVTMAKLMKELNNVSSVSAAGPESISFSSYRAGVLYDHTLAMAGNTITYDGDILTDQVDSFELGYYDAHDGAHETTWTSTRRIIEFTIALNGADGVVIEFTKRVRPRNL